ncbi:uncharacterized protein LOC134227015 [Armigeres subalbatus]|uniref:uncharacterized protein LOC134227015 n=1 Tax=Armigeres subalbatus TaxID=124917 RepID=UPI002ED4AE9F
MACFTWLPNEILEHIFQYLDFKNRRNLSLVCNRWNEVLLSERYLRKHVILHIEGCRLLDGKTYFRRNYEALSIKLENQYSSEMTKNLRLVNSVCPNPAHLRIDNLSSDQRFALIFSNTFFSFENVEQLHLIGTCKTEKGYLCTSFDNLKVLKIETSYVEYFRLIAPQLTELYLYVCSEDHMDLLPQFADQLLKLTLVFDNKDIYYFFNLNFPQIRELSIDRRLKGMTKSEQDISIMFFRRLKQLRKLHLTVKFIDSYVMQMISTSLSNLTELTLLVSEGTIELSNISKLIKLEKLKIEAEKFNLLNAKFPHLRQLSLGSPDLRSGAYVYAFESLMIFNSLRMLALHNVKFYPEVLKLTPSYNVEYMYVTNYKRLEETHLQMLVRRFPAVKWLRIAHCPGFTMREVEKLKRMNPKLCVAFTEVTKGRL